MSSLTTVIIPCYNAARTIEEAYRSLPAVDTPQGEFLEILMVDDCSTDDTADVIANLASTDRRVKPIYNHKNAGVSASRNLAIDKANGTFVMFMDADDKSMGDGVATLVAHMTDDVDFVRGKHFLWNAQTDKMSENKGDERNSIELHTVSPMAVPQITAIYSSWNALFRRDLIQKHKLRFDPKMKLGEDREFNLQYLMNCRRITMLSDYTYLWRKDCEGGQQATQVLVQDPSEVFASIHKMVGQITSTDFSQWARHRKFLSTAMVVEVTNFLTSFSKMIDQRTMPEQSFKHIEQIISQLQPDWILRPLSDVKGFTEPFADLYTYVQGHLGTMIDDAFYREFLKRLGAIRKILNTPSLAPITVEKYRDQQALLQGVFDLGRARRPSETLDLEIKLLKQARVLDVGYYRSQNPDVAANGMDAIAHYVQFGASEMRNPNAWFNTSRYFATHPELVLSGVNPLVHYISISAFQMNWIS